MTYDVAALRHAFPAQSSRIAHFDGPGEPRPRGLLHTVGGDPRGDGVRRQNGGERSGLRRRVRGSRGGAGLGGAAGRVGHGGPSLRYAATVVHGPPRVTRPARGAVHRDRGVLCDGTARPIPGHRRAGAPESGRSMDDRADPDGETAGHHLVSGKEPCRRGRRVGCRPTGPRTARSDPYPTHTRNRPAGRPGQET